MKITSTSQAIDEEVEEESQVIQTFTLTMLKRMMILMKIALSSNLNDAEDKTNNNDDKTNDDDDDDDDADNDRGRRVTSTAT